MNRGVPPTARKARTGELTPPGVPARARSKSAADPGASAGYSLPSADAMAGGSTAGVELTGPVSQAFLGDARAALITTSEIAEPVAPPLISPRAPASSGLWTTCRPWTLLEMLASDARKHHWQASRAVRRATG